MDAEICALVQPADLGQRWGADLGSVWNVVDAVSLAVHPGDLDEACEVEHGIPFSHELIVIVANRAIVQRLR